MLKVMRFPFILTPFHINGPKAEIEKFAVPIVMVDYYGWYDQ